MRTVKENGFWNLFDGRGVLVKRGTFQEVIDAMKEMW